MDERIKDLESRLSCFKDELQKETEKCGVEFSAWSCIALKDLIRDTENRIYLLKLRSE